MVERPPGSRALVGMFVVWRAGEWPQPFFKPFASKGNIAAFTAAASSTIKIWLKHCALPKACREHVERYKHGTYLCDPCWRRVPRSHAAPGPAKRADARPALEQTVNE